MWGTAAAATIQANMFTSEVQYVIQKEPNEGLRLKKVIRATLNNLTVTCSHDAKPAILEKKRRN